MVEWGRESKTAEMYTEGEIRIISELLFRSAFTRLVHRNILISSSFSTFASLIQGHRKKPNHFNLSSFLDFRKFYTRPPQDTELFFLLVSWIFRDS